VSPFVQRQVTEERLDANPISKNVKNASELLAFYDIF
jgi:hypothetical protein